MLASVRLGRLQKLKIIERGKYGLGQKGRLKAYFRCHRFSLGRGFGFLGRCLSEHEIACRLSSARGGAPWQGQARLLEVRAIWHGVTADNMSAL